MRRPCACHVFTAADRTYAYDVGHNQVYAVDAALGAVIAAWGDEARLAELRRELGAAEFDRAAAELRTAREEENLFRPFELQLSADGPPPAFAGTGHLTLGVTEQCNLRCRYCPYTADAGRDRPHRDVPMTAGTALAALRLLRRPDGDDDPASTVSFYGGEPLLNLGVIRRVVAEIRTWDGPQPRLVIDTNGVGLDDAAADFVAAEGIELQISLDGPAEVHDRYRRDVAGRPTHAAVVAGVGRVLDRDPEAARRLAFAATLAPPCDLMGVIAYFADFPPYRDRGLDPDAMARIRFADLPGPADAWPAAIGDEMARELALARAAYVDACRTGRRGAAPWSLRNLFDGDLIRYHHRPRGPLAGPWTPGGCCRPGERTLFVRADGVLQPCERVAGAFALGTAATGPDPAVITRMQREFLAAVAPRCASCWAVRLCDLCFVPLAAGWTEDGSAPGRVPESACAGALRRAAHTLALHTTLAAGGDGALDFLDGSKIL